MAGPPEAVVQEFLRAARSSHWGRAQGYMTQHVQGRLARESFGAMQQFLQSRLEPSVTFEVVRVASRDGVVRFVGWRGGHGRLVILDHGSGLTTWYGHASTLLVRAGQRVSRGDVIALVGTSGRVTGPHVYFAVRQGETPMDPWPFLTGRTP